MTEESLESVLAAGEELVNITAAEVVPLDFERYEMMNKTRTARILVTKCMRSLQNGQSEVSLDDLRDQLMLLYGDESEFRELDQRIKEFLDKRLGNTEGEQKTTKKRKLNKTSLKTTAIRKKRKTDGAKKTANAEKSAKRTNTSEGAKGAKKTTVSTGAKSPKKTSVAKEAKSAKKTTTAKGVKSPKRITTAAKSVKSPRKTASSESAKGVKRSTSTEGAKSSKRTANAAEGAKSAKRTATNATVGAKGVKVPVKKATAVNKKKGKSQSKK